jgi:hypothetical protein
MLKLGSTKNEVHPSPEIPPSLTTSLEFIIAIIIIIIIIITN